MVQFRNFDLLKVFGYIKRGVGDNIVYYIKPEASNPTFFRKSPILHHTCATYSEPPSYMSTMLKTGNIYQCWAAAGFPNCIRGGGEGGCRVVPIYTPL